MDTSFLNHANKVLINVYDFWPVQFSHGMGVYLYDEDGNEYLDFGAGIAVNALGYAHPSFVKAVTEQAGKLHLGLCYVADKTRIEAANLLLKHSSFDQVFFCSTGAEAVEGALKTARKWGREEKGITSPEMIYVQNSFHGRTMGALSVNGQDIYRRGFEPLLAGTKEAIFNDIGSIESLVSSNTVAVIVEPVLGEGGIIPASKDFLVDLRALCSARNIALIFDEVQCGIGRTGTLFAYEQYGVVPDLICLAKGLGAGFPVGAFMGKRRFTSHITPGSHGSTYGGNPLACRVVHAVVSEIIKPAFLEQVEDVGRHIRHTLGNIANQTGLLSNVRGTGMMIAADYTGGPVKGLVKSLLKNGLITLTCGENSLRIVPPLILTKEQADKGLSILKKTIEQEKK